jgi:hypothetical protein
LKEPRTRKEKISFLRDVIAGKRKSIELIAEDNLIVVSMEDENGNMKHTCRGKELTEEEFKQYEKKYPNAQTIVVTLEEKNPLLVL